MSLSSELSEEAASAPIGDNVNGEDNKSTVIPAESTDSPNNDWLLARLARALLAVILYVVFTYSVSLSP